MPGELGAFKCPCLPLLREVLAAQQGQGDIAKFCCCWVQDCSQAAPHSCGHRRAGHGAQIARAMHWQSVPRRRLPSARPPCATPSTPCAARRTTLWRAQASRSASQARADAPRAARVPSARSGAGALVDVAAADGRGAPDAALRHHQLVLGARLVADRGRAHVHQAAQAVELHAVLQERAEGGHRLPGYHPARCSARLGVGTGLGLEFELGRPTRFGRHTAGPRTPAPMQRWRQQGTAQNDLRRIAASCSCAACPLPAAGGGPAGAPRAAWGRAGARLQPRLAA